MAKRFNPEKAVDDYRAAVAAMEKQTTAAGKARWQKRIEKLLADWKDWDGDDQLHEYAFGDYVIGPDDPEDE